MSFVIKRNDLGPDLGITIEAPAGTAVDLTGTTVRFHMKLPGASSAKVDAAANIDSATDGEVSYTWQSGDTDTAGLYLAEFEVTFAGSVVRTFPVDDYLYVNVLPDLA